MAWYRDYFPPSTPIAAKGGIKARSKRGAFSASWWGRRWLDVLEALNLGSRLERARRYARKGQVLAIDIGPGKVHAEVQGSRPQAYKIKIGVKQLAEKETERLRTQLAATPYFLAKLLAGEMPRDMETLFAAARVALFPVRASELHTECSCPDWSNPCKHIAAVYYLLGEEFDRDPFLMFRLRGLDIDKLLGQAGVAPSPEAASREDEEADEKVEIATPGMPPQDSFWEGSRPEVDLAAAGPSSQAAPLLRRLGNLPFWRGEQSLLESLEPTYAAANAAALNLLAGSDGTA